MCVGVCVCDWTPLTARPVCWCWFYSLELPTIRKPAESKWSDIRIRAQYSLPIVMVPFALEILLLNCGVLNLSNKIFFQLYNSFTKAWIPQSYFYLIIRFLSPYQNSYFTKLQVTLQFLWQAAYTQYKQYSQVTYARFE